MEERIQPEEKEKKNGKGLPCGRKIVDHRTGKPEGAAYHGTSQFLENPGDSRFLALPALSVLREPKGKRRRLCVRLQSLQDLGRYLSGFDDLGGNSFRVQKVGRQQLVYERIL